MNNYSKNTESKEFIENESISLIKQNNKTYIQSLTSYKILYLYFKFSELLKNYLEKSKLLHEEEVYLIDYNWFNNFKNKCNYNSLESEIKRHINTDYQIIINKFAKEKPLSPEIFDKKPQFTKKNAKNKNEYYSENYEIINEEIMDCFKKIFQDVPKFRKYKIIIKNPIIILIYNAFNLEIITNYADIDKKERFVFTVNEKPNLKNIEKIFKSSNFDDALKKLDITDKYLSFQIIKFQDIEIGTMKYLENNIFFKTQENFYRRGNMNMNKNILKESNLFSNFKHNNKINFYRGKKIL